ncbi:hypothetical protein [Larkinella soli]|uniref:hypothetical protein n=1 Tax=Larkinella soli TaxID=1770527 RepID=UPI000FFC91BA|nr:hypothetical protein [Larkinella soli]
MSHFLNPKVAGALVVGLTAAIVAACNVESAEPGFGGNTIIEGRVFLPDTLTNAPLPLPKAVVRIRFKPGDPEAFDYTDTTDADGYYRFANLTGKKSGVKSGYYYLSCTYSLTTRFGRVRYVARDSVDIPNKLDTRKSRVTKNLTLQRDSAAKDGFFIFGVTKIDDILTGSKVVQPKVTVRLTTDSSRQSPYLYSQESDASGYYRFNNLAEGKYYLSYQYSGTASGQTLLYTKKEDANLMKGTQTALQKDALLSFAPATGDLVLSVIDGDSTPQASFSYCIFTNKQTWNVATTCEGSLISGKTNRQGRDLVRGLRPNVNYYVLATDSLFKVRLTGKQTIQLQSNTTFPINITVK